MFFHGRSHGFCIDADTRSVYHGRRTHQFHSPLVGHGEQMPSGSLRFQSVHLLLPFGKQLLSMHLFLSSKQADSLKLILVEFYHSNQSS